MDVERYATPFKYIVRTYGGWPVAPEYVYTTWCHLNGSGRQPPLAAVTATSTGLLRVDTHA